MTRTNRRRVEKGFKIFCQGVTWAAVLTLAVLLLHIFQQGVEWLSVDFLQNFQSRKPEALGIKAGIWGTLWTMALTSAFSIPLGVATAVFLEEYAPRGRVFHLIQINIANLAGMPSIIYGLLGLAIFVRMLGLGRCVLSGSLTLALLVMPVIVIASQGAIRAVPRSIRDAAYAMGARRWQVVLFQVLPAAIPGIATGVILALSRAMGETAPLIVVGALSYVAFVPEGPMDQFTSLPVQIFNWSARPQPAFHGLAAGGIIVLLVILLSLNMVAIIIRQKFQRYRS